jgi:hypothetical protein
MVTVMTFIGYLTVFCYIYLISTIFPEDDFFNYFTLIFVSYYLISTDFRWEKNQKIARRIQNMENNYILKGCVNDFRLFVFVLIFNYFIFLTRIISHVKYLFQFSYVETVLCAIGDEFPHILRKRRNNIIFRAIVIGSAFLLGLPMVCNVSRN